jgi:hypothetical protein
MLQIQNAIQSTSCAESTNFQQQQAADDATTCFSTWGAGFVLVSQALEHQFEACCSDANSLKAA